MGQSILFPIRLVWEIFEIDQVDLFWFYNYVLVSNIIVEIFYVIYFELLVFSVFVIDFTDVPLNDFR
jgi:hypothetical protein